MREQILPFDKERCSGCPFWAVNGEGCDMIEFSAQGAQNSFRDCLGLMPLNCPADELLDIQVTAWRDDLSGLDIEIILDGALSGT